MQTRPAKHLETDKYYKKLPIFDTLEPKKGSLFGIQVAFN